MDHSSHNMSGMDTTTSNSGMTGMHTMMSMGTFHWSTSGDGIWIESWIPQSEGAYIGACFGLFFFAVLSRGLPALEAYFVAWKTIQDNKIYNHKIEKTVVSSANKIDIEKPPSVCNDVSEYPAPTRLPIVPPFSWSTDIIRSVITALTAFISYLLMMVVMTGNAGFFFIIVGGIFLGEIVFGRFRSLIGLSSDYCH
ncbi:Ctr copper transporter family-domain-containing protein [Pilobolus umbonatus]|nr:Ctr copper transporter family-domain-containing protein [Pilobolus umbonatus]